MAPPFLLPLLIALPATIAVACLLPRSARQVLALNRAGVVATGALAVLVAVGVLRDGPVDACRAWLRADALTAWHLLLLAMVFVLSSVYARGTFEDQEHGEGLTTWKARQFAALWSGSMAAMVLVLLSNNLGVMWVGLEATTALTAFLISLSPTAGSIEAVWKYLLICSIGLCLAFMGTLLTAAAASELALGPRGALLWTTLRDQAALLRPTELRVGFLFLLVGYGTKAGLAPMHTWLPDAHSQAPAPVSALFSGFMLNTALYCVMRFLPLVEGSPGGKGWALELLVVFGLVSILLAAAFILFQRDVKRLLAYHSVEHMGIISLGLGLGGLGTSAALFHTLNHSLCKTVAFFCAGRLGSLYGSHDMDALRGSLRAAPLWGGGLLASVLALIGLAPFAVFMSELQVVQAAVQGGAWLPLVLFLLGGGTVFVAALGHVIDMAWGPPARAVPAERTGIADAAVVVLPLLALLLLGLWLPAPLADAIAQAQAVVGGAR